MIGILAAAAAVVIIVLVATGVFHKGRTPEETVKQMEEAMNSLDMDSLMDCYDEDAQAVMEGTLDLVSELSDTDLGGLMDIAGAFGGLLEDYMPEFSLTINDIEYSDKKNCVVYVTLTYDAYGSSSSQEIPLPMTKENGDFCITMSGWEAIADYYGYSY